MTKKNNQNPKLIDTDKVYDSVFWAEANVLSRYLPMLVNEAFGEHFTTNAKVDLLPNKQITETTDGKKIRRDVDMLFTLTENLDSTVYKLYHYEIETKGRSSIAIRIAQYATAHAFTSILAIDDGAEIEIPYSCVIFLRTDSTDISKLTVYINYPGGRVSYNIPVLKIKDYTLDYIFEKMLLLLIPFYVFNIPDKDFEEMEKDATKISEIEVILTDINYRLQKLVDAGELNSHEKGNILHYTIDVLTKLLEKHPKTQKGVNHMSIAIIRTEFDEMQDIIDMQKAQLAEQETALAQKDNTIAQKDAEIIRLTKLLSEKA